MGAHVRGKLGLTTSRSRGSSALAVIGGCLGVYAVCAVAFHWVVEPTVARNRGPALEPVPVRTAQDTRPAAPARSEPVSSVAAKPVAAAASETKKTDRSELRSRAAAKPPTSTAAASESANNTSNKKSARSEATHGSPKTPAPAIVAGPSPAPVIAAVPEAKESGRSEPTSTAASPSGVAAETTSPSNGTPRSRACTPR